MQADYRVAAQGRKTGLHMGRSSSHPCGSARNDAVPFNEAGGYWVPAFADTTTEGLVPKLERIPVKSIQIFSIAATASGASVDPALIAWMLLFERDGGVKG